MRCIWFTPQTGVIRYSEPQAPSNFHTYRLPASCLGRVKLATAEAEAQPGAGLLSYPPDFLEWLEKKEQS